MTTLESCDRTLYGVGKSQVVGYDDDGSSVRRLLTHDPSKPLDGR